MSLEYYYFAPVGLKNIVLSISVCLVCLSVCQCVCLSTWLNFTNFWCMLPVTVAQSSSDGIVICYVLPVLRMTLCFHTMRPMGGLARRCVVCHVAVTMGMAADQGGPLWPSGLAGRIAGTPGGASTGPGTGWRSGCWTELLLVTVMCVLPCTSFMLVAQWGWSLLVLSMISLLLMLIRTSPVIVFD